jgi:SAM-dependent methyltransferase
LPGRAAGLLMAHRSSNRRRNAWAVSLLDVRPDDRVLEIGFGPGLAILELSRIAHVGHVCGIDHSEQMLRQARRPNADGIARGVVDLRLGSVDALPVFDAPFDKILAVNTVLFWMSRTCASSSCAGCCAPLADRRGPPAARRATRRRRPTAGRSLRRYSEPDSPRCGWRPCP